MIHFHADLDLIIAEAGDENRPARIAGIAVLGMLSQLFQEVSASSFYVARLT
jgi:hypothetical protein